MNTATRRAASARFHAERKAAGWKKVTLWLDPDAQAKVESLKTALGSTADVAIRHAITNCEDAAEAGYMAPKWAMGQATGPAPWERLAPLAGAVDAANIALREAKANPPTIQLGPTKTKPGSRLKGKKT